MKQAQNPQPFSFWLRKAWLRDQGEGGLPARLEGGQAQAGHKGTPRPARRATGADHPGQEVTSAQMGVRLRVPCSEGPQRIPPLKAQLMAQRTEGLEQALAPGPGLASAPVGLVDQVSDPVESLRGNRTRKARGIIAKELLSLRSQVFQSRRHVSSQERVRSTTQRLGMSAKVESSLGLATSTSAPRSSWTLWAKGAPS